MQKGFPGDQNWNVFILLFVVVWQKKAKGGQMNERASCLSIDLKGPHYCREDISLNEKFKK
jgi:hypothetical protein